jgi:hypothetical protein
MLNPTKHLTDSVVLVITVAVASVVGSVVVVAMGLNHQVVTVFVAQHF